MYREEGTHDRHPADRYPIINPPTVNQYDLPPQFLKVEGVVPRSRMPFHSGNLDL